VEETEARVDSDWVAIELGSDVVVKACAVVEVD
jgi:hypothetical protein